MTEVLHHLMRELIEYSIILLELIGVLVLSWQACPARYRELYQGDPHPREIVPCYGYGAGIGWRILDSYRTSFLKSHWLAASLF